MSHLIAIEGIDGAGKGTQAARLVAALRAAGRSVALLSFPRYQETSFGRRIGEFLNGRFGTLDQVSPFLAALLYAGDRFESKPVLSAAIAENDVVVLDRYVASNIAHQCAKLAGAERDELRNWIEHVEFEVHGLPRPDLTILFDLPAPDAQGLIARKQQRAYTQKAADLQEADTGYLSRVREVYRELADGDACWQRVAVMSDGRVRGIEDIAAEVLGRVTGSFFVDTPDPET